MDVSSWTVPKIKAELLSRGLSTDGLKPVLVARLNEALKKNAEGGEEEGAEGSEGISAGSATGNNAGSKAGNNAGSSAESGAGNNAGNDEEETNSARNRREAVEKDLQQAAAAAAAVAAAAPTKKSAAKGKPARAPAAAAHAETAAQRKERLQKEIIKADENEKQEKYQEWIQKFGERFQPGYKPNNNKAGSSNEKMNNVQQRRIPSKKVKRISKSRPRGKGSVRIYNRGLSNAIARNRISYITNVRRATHKLHRIGTSYANFKQSVATNSDQFKRLKVEYASKTYEISRLDTDLKERDKIFVADRDAFLRNYGVLPSDYLKSEISKGKAPSVVAAREEAERLIKYHADTKLIIIMRSEREKDLSRIKMEITNKTERLKKALPTLPANMIIRLIPKNILNAEKKRKQTRRDEKAAAVRKSREEAKKKEEENIQKRAREV
jgi:hypothetical protein